MRWLEENGVQYAMIPGEYVEYTSMTNYWFGFIVGFAVATASCLLIMIIANAVVECRKNKRK